MEIKPAPCGDNGPGGYLQCAAPPACSLLSRQCACMPWGPCGVQRKVSPRSRGNTNGFGQLRGWGRETWLGARSWFCCSEFKIDQKSRSVLERRTISSMTVWTHDTVQQTLLQDRASASEERPQGPGLACRELVLELIPETVPSLTRNIWQSHHLSNRRGRLSPE